MLFLNNSLPNGCLRRLRSEYSTFAVKIAKSDFVNPIDAETFFFRPPSTHKILNFEEVLDPIPEL